MAKQATTPTAAEKAAIKARAVFDKQMAALQEREEKEAADKKAAAKEAVEQDLARRLKERRAEGRESVKATRGDSTALEQASKEASVPGSDPRESVFDPAPGKTIDEQLTRNDELAAGEHGSPPAREAGVQYFVVTDEADLIEVAAKLGLPDHGELGAINGRYNSVYTVQPGQRVVLPADYTFVGIDGVITEGEETEELAGAEATA